MEQQVNGEAMTGIDWGCGGARAVVMVEARPDGSLKILDAEVTPDGTGGPSETD